MGRNRVAVRLKKHSDATFSADTAIKALNKAQLTDSNYNTLSIRTIHRSILTAALLLCAACIQAQYVGSGSSVFTFLDLLEMSFFLFMNLSSYLFEDSVNKLKMCCFTHKIMLG